MRVIFFGTPAFAATSLQAIASSQHQVVEVVAQPDRPAGRGMRLQKPAAAVMAQELGLPLSQPQKIRNEAFFDEVSRTNAEVAVVVAYGRILPAELLAIPPHGFINVHGSLLPRYRGAAPIQRAIQNGEVETGVSIMRIDEQLDHGPVMLERRLRIGADERAPALTERLAVLGAEAVVAALDLIEAGEAVWRDQDHQAATYAAKIEKEEGRIDWQEEARRLYDRFRAFDPWPGIFCRVGEEQVRLADVFPAGGEGAPGEILAFDGGALVVAAGAGALGIRQMQRPGKTRASAADTARGLRLREGDRLV